MGNSGGLLTHCLHDVRQDDDFDNTYEVDEDNYIGTGKFAVVHLCWKRCQPEKRFALKVINTRVGDTASLNRIREEINILRTLGNHPGMVSLIDVDETLIGNIRLVLELCEGGELYDRIQQKQYYPEHEAKACCRQLMEAVSYIHANGVMHRDLKPENILLASKVSNTDIKISDFGLAKISRDFPRRLPRSHSICGSDFYLAPEVIKQEEYGREIDVWAVGVITYVLLSGALPFFHEVLHKLYRQIVERDLNFPEQAWRNVSKGALDFILRLLQVRAGDRLTAEQALGHPWLRGAGGSSFNSFEDGAPSRRFAGGATPLRPGYHVAQQPSAQSSGSLSRNVSDSSAHSSQPGAVPHPLQHAHMVARLKAQTAPPTNPRGQDGEAPQERCAPPVPPRCSGGGALPGVLAHAWAGGPLHCPPGHPSLMNCPPSTPRRAGA